MGLGDTVRRMMSAPIRALLPKNRAMRWAIYLLPILVAAFFVEPLFNILIKLIELFARLIEPLWQNTVGRLVLLVGTFVLGGMTMYVLFRARYREFRGRVWLGKHMQAVSLLINSDGKRSRDLLLRIGKHRGAKPTEYPWTSQDANLKLARLALERNDRDAALRFLTRVVEQDLPKELLRSLLQLRVQALRDQPGTLPETLEQEIRSALRTFEDDFVLQKELRACLLARGDRAGAIEAQVRAHKAASPLRKPSERQLLIDDLFAAGIADLAQGDVDAARSWQKKLAKLDATRGGLLLAEIEAWRGEIRAAVQTFGRTMTPEGLDRIAELLAEHPGVVDVRELLAWCPMQGTLLLAARELARQGRSEEARRAAARAAEALGPTATVCTVLAETLTLLDAKDDAQRLAEQAMQRLLLPDPREASS